MFRSGTDEEYTEREALLQDFVDLQREAEKIKQGKPKVEKKQMDIHKRAMETLNGRLQIFQ